MLQKNIYAAHTGTDVMIFEIFSPE
jgi:hypothetical protein